MSTDTTITEALVANVSSLLQTRSVLAVSRATGLSLKTVYRYRSGERLPRIDDLVRIASYFDVTPADLLHIGGDQ